MRRVHCFAATAFVAILGANTAGAAEPKAAALGWPASNPVHLAYFCGNADKADNTMPVGYGTAISKELKARNKSGATDGQAFAQLRKVAACEGEMKQVGAFIEMDMGSTR